MESLVMQQEQSSVSQRSGIQIVESFFDAWRTMDLASVFALLSEDIVYQNVPFRPHHGRTEVEPVLRRLCRGSEAFYIELLNIAVRDGVVLTERTDRAVGPWIDITFWVCGTFAIRDGKIALWRDRFDRTQLALELIVSPFRRLARRRVVAKRSLCRGSRVMPP